ncbi:MAG: 5'/3'-nucleotidase SurE [Candidatus Zixiibacteriota bacterium]|nr:MAG: 5'/3'-nucleotidase SurE [candidate division Zixibacteria bacterium]
MRVLICNDDGIYAPGLAALVEEVKKIADVTVVAPEFEQSAKGHAITISDPLRAKEYFKDLEFFGWAVSGTPADCVKIAISALMDRRPDLVISGINEGSNTGINIIYSGTVSAATEGRINGIPSFAVSLTSYTYKDFGPSARFAARLAEKYLSIDLPPGIFFNVNVPAMPEEQIKGVKMTRQGRAIYEEIFHRRFDPKGRAYFWMDGERVAEEDDPNIDEQAIRAGYISITPIHYDLTHYPTLEQLGLKIGKLL